MSHEIKLVAVDDDDDVRLVIKMMVARHQVHFVGASDMISAMLVVEGASVVLVDLNCGNSNGIDIIRECRLKLGASAKIYLMSGTADQKDQDEAAAAGADGFIPKPFPSGALDRIVTATYA